MDIEKVFRTNMFGGFRKTDVLSYVEALKKTMEELKAELAEKDEKSKDLSLNVEKLTEQCNSLKAVQERYLAQAETLTSLRGEKEELARQVEELQSTAERYESEQNAFREREEKLRAAQFQLGAAFLDARKYSDKIVAAANDRAAEISGKISGEISAQAQQVSELSAEVDRIAEDFERAAQKLHDNIAALAKRMSLSASELSVCRNEPPFVPDVTIQVDETDVKTGAAMQVLPNAASQAAPDGAQPSILRFGTPKEG